MGNVVAPARATSSFVVSSEQKRDGGSSYFVRSEAHDGYWVYIRSMTADVLLYEAIILVSLVASLYYVIVFPVLTLADCLLSKQLSRFAKTRWFIVILLSWPVGATIYGIFISRRALYRWSFLAGLIAGAMLWLILGTGVLYPG